MPQLTLPEVTQRFIEAAQQASPDDLVAIHNELFPRTRTTEAESTANPQPVRDRILGHIGNGLEIEEVLDLWRVVFPRQRPVWFDEEDGLLHYEERRAALTETE